MVCFCWKYYFRADNHELRLHKAQNGYLKLEKNKTLLWLSQKVQLRESQNPKDFFYLLKETFK